MSKFKVLELGKTVQFTRNPDKFDPANKNIIDV